VRREGRQDRFVWPVRVYYEDTDSGGVVYHVHYLKYLERARTEWLRELGVVQERLAREQGLLFAVHTIVLDYLAPARLDDLLQVGVEVAELGGASITFSQEIIRRGEEPLCRGRIKVACLGVHDFRPRPLPREIRAKIPNGGSV